MALQKELWIASIVENLYPDNSFASKSVDDSAFVNHKKVHVPNAGKPSAVVINRSSKPATIKERTDYDLEYVIDELTTDPVHISNADSVELSYNKRNSVIANDRANLHDTAHQNLLYRWFVKENVVLTTGTARPAHTHVSATGNRKKITKGNVLSLMTAFDKANIPQVDRYLLLDAEMYADLLADLTESEKTAFLQSANAQKGVIGNLYGFDVMKRSRVLRVKASDKSLLEWEKNPEATELAAGIAWQKDCVSRAVGEVKMFGDEDSPTYYGDIYSFLLRTGGSPRRYDKAGVMLIVENASA